MSCWSSDPGAGFLPVTLALADRLPSTLAPKDLLCLVSTWNFPALVLHPGFKKRRLLCLGILRLAFSKSSSKEMVVRRKSAEK